ncbi:MATE family efflux transporter [SAR202 cluster bacterium AC-647-N09_OGT_505m]|nr:MATE family efflux transporter [SAR202 cluster bacterium AC-647-N09_OGT_505m]
MDKSSQDFDQTSPETSSRAIEPAKSELSSNILDRSSRTGRRRSAYATRDLTTGSIPRNLLFIAWPQFVEGFLRVVDQMADLVWAGFMGTRAIAGMGVAQQYTQMAFTGRQGIDVSQRAMISRAIGMGDKALANHILMQAWTMTLIFCSIMVMIGVMFTEPMLRILGLSEEVIVEAAPYMRLYFIGHMATGFQQVSGHALAAAGDTLTLMKSTTVARITHLVLSPLLVFGLAGFPEMGISGAAVANIIAHTISVSILFWVLFRGTSRLHPKLSEYRFDGPMLWQMFKLGVPAAINGMERTGAQLIMIFLVTPFGDMAVAAFAVTRRVEQVANLGSQGMGLASGVIVGQSLGAKKPERAKQTIYWAVGYVMLVKSILSTLLFVFPVLFLSIFSRDPEFLDLAQTWVRILVLGFLAMGWGQVLQNSFQMAGDTLFPMLITLGSLWIIGIPLAYALTEHTGLGQFGIAWATVIAMLIRAGAYIPYFYWGRWLRISMFSETDTKKKI